MQISCSIKFSFTLNYKSSVSYKAFKDGRSYANTLQPQLDHCRHAKRQI